MAPLCPTAGPEGPSAHSVLAAVHLREAQGPAGATGRARLPVPHGDSGHRDRHPAPGVSAGFLRAHDNSWLPPLSESQGTQPAVVWKSLLRRDETLCMKI